MRVREEQKRCDFYYAISDQSDLQTIDLLY